MNLHGKMLAVTIAGLLLVLSAVFLRWPGVETSIIMSIQMNVFLNCGKRPLSERANSIFFTSLLGGGFQLALSVLRPNVILSLCALFFGTLFCMYTFRRRRAEAVIILVIAVISMKATPGMLAGINRFVLIQFSGLWALLAIYAAETCIPMSEEPKEDFPEVSLHQAFAMAVVLTFSFWLYQALQMPEGYWIAFTVLLIHSGGIFGDIPARRAFTRMVMAPMGFWAGFCLLYIFCWYEHWFAYTFFVWPILGNYILIKYRLVGWRIFFQMIFFVLIYDVMNGEYRQFDVLNMLVCRSAAIMLGAFFAILTEPGRERPLHEIAQVA